MKSIRAGCLLWLLAIVTAACDIRLTFPSVTNTNTNDNRFAIDSHDVLNFNPAPVTPTTPTTPTTPGTDVTLPLPSDAQATAALAASSSQAQFYLAHSCQDRDGLGAWQFLDFIVTALKSKDPRWGYLCKAGNCADISRDVIAYRATNDNFGVWAVDIIGNHCPIAPAVSTFTWQVLGFDPAAVWKESRQ